MDYKLDAKQKALQKHPLNRDLGINLFLDYLGVGLDDFEYKEGVSANEYIYGKPRKVNNGK